MSEVKKTREEWLEEARASRVMAAVGFLIAVVCTSIAVGYYLGAGAAFAVLAGVGFLTFWRGKLLAMEELEKAEAADENGKEED